MFHIGQHISQTLREQGRTVTWFAKNSTPARMILKGGIPKWFGDGGTAFFRRESAIFFSIFCGFLARQADLPYFCGRKRKQWND